MASQISTFIYGHTHEHYLYWACAMEKEMEATNDFDPRTRVCVSLPASLLARLQRVIPAGRRSRALELAAELVIEAHEERAERAQERT